MNDEGSGGLEGLDDLTRNIQVLDVGCGNNKVPGAIGIDRVKTTAMDKVCEVGKEKIPYQDSYFDVVYMRHVLEHIPNTIFTMEEVYRVLKPQGIVHIEVPHFTSLCAIMDITHCKLFSISSMAYFQQNNCFSYYSKASFEIVEAKFTCYNHTLMPIVYLMNLRPGLFERFALRFLMIDVNIYWKLRKADKNVSE